MSQNLGLNFYPILLTGQVITPSIHLGDATVITTPGDTQTYNLSQFAGNTGSYENLTVQGNQIVDGDVNIGGNLEVGLTVQITPEFMIVPILFASVINSGTANLDEINSKNITNEKTITTSNLTAHYANLGSNTTGIYVSQGRQSMFANLVGNILANIGYEAPIVNIFGNTFINGVNIKTTGEVIGNNGLDLTGTFTLRNPNNPSDYFQFRPELDAIYFGGGNVKFDGQTNNYFMTFDGWEKININDPLFINQTTTTGENLLANSLTLNSFTPSTTTSKLYNVNGRLYFNGSLIEGNISGNYVPLLQPTSDISTIQKYQTSFSRYTDFTSIPNGGTYLYYSVYPYPSHSDLPSQIYIANLNNSSQKLQLYDASTFRRVGYLDGHEITFINNGNHRVAIYFSDVASPQLNIFDGVSTQTHLDIDNDEIVKIVYNNTLSYYYVASRGGNANLETYTIKFNNFESIGTFSATNINALASTLNIGSTNLNTLNLATSSGVQTVNLGTGLGQTTINIGQNGDIINMAGNVLYNNVDSLIIKDKTILLNGNSIGSGTARQSGIEIRDNNSNIAGYILTNDSGTGYKLKAPEDSREINLDLPNFVNGVLQVASNVVSSGSITNRNYLPSQIAYEDEANIFNQQQQATSWIATNTGAVFQPRRQASTNGQFITFQDAGGGTSYGIIDSASSTGSSAVNGATDPYALSFGSYSLASNVYLVHNASQANSQRLKAHSGGIEILNGSLITHNQEINYVGDALKLNHTGAHAFISWNDGGRYAYIGRPNNGSSQFRIDCSNVVSTQLLLSAGVNSNIRCDSVITMNNNKITDLATPTNSTDATTKAYVDNIANANALLSSNNNWSGQNQFGSSISIRPALNSSNYLLFAPSVSGTNYIYNGDKSWIWDGQNQAWIGMGFQNFPGGIQFGSRVYCFNPIDPLTFQRYTDTNRMTTTYLDSSNSAKAYIDVAGSSGQSVFTGATANSFNIGITDIATEIAFWINNNPKAYITQGPTYTFTVLGSAFAFTGSWIDGSDRRTKQNIEELAREKAISRIKALKTVEYDYIENNRHSIGFIAQDIQEIIPDAVMDGGKENMLGVAYNVVLSHLVPVVQHLLDENEKLKARLAKIEANGLLFA